MAMFLGGALVAGGLGAALAAGGGIGGLPAPDPAWLGPAAGLAAAFLLGNFALQYGAARLPANVTAVVMLVEVVFASVSAVLFGGAQLGGATLLGGALIVAAAALSWLEPAAGP